jgi:alpha-tubulin suppressor-like RCC1 family protein
MQKGQLGHGDLAQRNTPTVVKALEGKFVAGGSCGRNHTAVFLRSGETYTWGSNVVVCMSCPYFARSQVQHGQMIVFTTFQQDMR